MNLNERIANYFQSRGTAEVTVALGKVTITVS